jgi:hypothetical protein
MKHSCTEMVLQTSSHSERNWNSSLNTWRTTRSNLQQMWALTQLLFSMWPCCCKHFLPFSLWKYLRHVQWSIFFVVQQLNLGLDHLIVGVSRPHTNTHKVGLLWTSDQLVKEAATYAPAYMPTVKGCTLAMGKNMSKYYKHLAKFVVKIVICKQWGSMIC